MIIITNRVINGWEMSVSESFTDKQDRYVFTSAYEMMRVLEDKLDIKKDLYGVEDGISNASNELKPSDKTNNDSWQMCSGEIPKVQRVGEVSHAPLDFTKSGDEFD